MPYFSPRFPALLVLLALLAITPGCITTQGSSTAPVNSGKPAGKGSAGTLQMFTPLAQRGAFPLPAKEAESLALKMNPRNQKLGSWQDLSFPISQSLAYAAARPTGTVAVNVPGLQLTYGQLATSLQHMQTLLPRLSAQPGLLAKEFTWYRIGPDFGFTGYYEPTLKASRTKSAAYPYPLYKVPSDIRKGVPYHTRNAIDRKGALAGRNLEIAWVSSEADAFFLHIQGSGRLQFADGTVSHVLYAGKNNCSYVPLGRIMRDRGLLAPDNVNMPSIRQCIVDNPALQNELFDANPSYVFFREAAQGPLGAMGRTLTPWVSTATDRSTLPHGAMVFATLPLPDNGGQHTQPFYGITLPQDTGGAIKGNRIDLFCGPGDQAAHTAGYLNTRGAVYILVKK